MMGMGALGQYALIEVENGATVVTVYGIGYEFSQPVRSARRLAAGANPAFFYQPNPITSMGWYQRLSEPVRFPKRLHAAANPAHFYQPAPIISVGWYEQLSEPKRFPKALPTPGQSFYAAEPEPEDLDVMGWFAPLSEPKRFKPRLDPSQNPTVVSSQQNFYTPYSRGYVIC